MQRHNPMHARLALLSALALSALCMSAISTRAADPHHGAPKLVEAQKAYDAARYDDALLLARRALGGAIPAADRLEAHRLLSMAYAQKGDKQAAREAARDLLRVYPAYAERESDPEAFREMLAEARALEEEGADRRPRGRVLRIVTYTAAAVMTAVVIALSAQDW